MGLEVPDIDGQVGEEARGGWRNHQITVKERGQEGGLGEKEPLVSPVGSL